MDEAESRKSSRGEAADTDPEREAKAADNDSRTTNGWLADMVYSHFTGVPLKALDAFIAACILALVAVIAVGVLEAGGIL